MAKILLVEDDKSLREIYGVRLMAEGYTIISAGDGEEALAVAIKERPDLIVSDVMMPKISGFDMLDILRSTTETKDIKVIMMTALSSEDQRARGEALGADRYLVKSQVGIEDVVRTVHDVLADGLPGAATAVPAFPAPATPAEPAPAVPVTPVPAPATVAPAPVAEPAPAPIAPPLDTPPLAAPAPIEVPATPPVAIMPELTPEPIPAPVAPIESPAPVEPLAPTPAPVTFPPSVTLPAPTAPFSSNPPASLGDRIISPLSSATDLGATSVTDIAAQMNQELNAQLQSIEQPVAPATPVAPIEAPAPAQYAAAPQPPVPPMPPLPPQPGL